MTAAFRKPGGLARGREEGDLRQSGGVESVGYGFRNPQLVLFTSRDALGLLSLGHLIS